MRKVLLLIGLLLALTACSTEIIMEQPTVQLRHAITAQGMAEFEVAPDLAKVRFRIETRAPTAQEAQLRNRELSANVEAALLQAGVRKNELETTNYRVNRIQEWDPAERKNIFKGYSVTNVFVVSTKAIDTVGPLLDVGIQAGANNVDSISFELSDAKHKEVKTEALRDATINAREKAEALALGAGVSAGHQRIPFCFSLALAVVHSRGACGLRRRSPDR